MDADQRLHFKAQEFSKLHAHLLSMQDSKNPSAIQWLGQANVMLCCRLLVDTDAMLSHMITR